MKITRRQLRRIIKEEAERISESARYVQIDQAVDALESSLLKQLKGQTIDAATLRGNPALREIVFDLEESGKWQFAPYKRS